MQVVKWLGEAYQWCYACDVGASQVGSTPTLTLTPTLACN